MNVKFELPNKIEQDTVEVDVRALVQKASTLATFQETSLGDVLAPLIVPALQNYLAENKQVVVDLINAY